MTRSFSHQSRFVLFKRAPVRFLTKSRPFGLLWKLFWSPNKPGHLKSGVLLCFQAKVSSSCESKVVQVIWQRQEVDQKSASWREEGLSYTTDCSDWTEAPGLLHDEKYFSVIDWASSNPLKSTAKNGDWRTLPLWVLSDLCGTGNPMTRLTTKEGPWLWQAPYDLNLGFGRIFHYVLRKSSV